MELLGPTTELGIAQNPLFVTHHNPIEKWFVVVVQNKRRQHFKIMIFLNLWSAHEAPTYQAFLPLQIVSNAK